MKTKDAIYRQITKIMLPLILQNLLSAMVSSADVIMLNYVGQSPISAVSLAVQYSNIIFMFCSGLGTGATILCAQYYGKKDYRAIRAVEGIALRLAIAVTVVFAIAAFTIPELMMRVFTDDNELISLGASYIRIVGVSYLCWGIIEVYLSVLRSTGRVVVCTVLNAITFALNILLNAVFIFGLFNVPKSDVEGVAMATSISRVIELLGCFIISLTSREVKLKLRYIFIRSKVLYRDFMKVSLPAIGNDVVWGLGFSMYSVIMGHMGSDVVAANSFVVIVRNFGVAICFGVATAGGILVGKLLGQNSLLEAESAAKKIVKLTIISGIIGGLIVLISTPFVLKFAVLSKVAKGYLKGMLLINVYYIMGSAVNTTFIAGLFRAGGDSRFGFICDIIDMWCYAVPLGLLAAFVFKLPVMWVYFLLCTDEFVKWPWVIKNYRSKKWIKNITREDIDIANMREELANDEL